MNWFTDYEAELRDVFRDAEQMIGGFPPPLHDRGLAYLYKFHPYKEGSTKNYICYLLPFWLKELDGVNERTCRDMALAGVFVMLHFFVEDDLMDTAPAEWKEQLALAHMFQLEFVTIYNRSFAADSPFWPHYRQYMTEWASGVAVERGADDYFLNPVRIAHKASPVKLASAGVLVQAGMEKIVPHVSDAVDRVLITLQMTDDRADWEEDLQLGSANGLLAYIRREKGLGEDVLLDREAVLSFIHIQGGLAGYARMAEERHGLLFDGGETTIRHLSDFHLFLISGLQREAAEMEQMKNRLLQGGFYYWMSKELTK
jgi:hypothetical protein